MTVRDTIPPHRVSLIRGLSRPFAVVALGLFVLCSAGLAFATAWSVGEAAAPARPQVAVDAEADLKSALDSRLHLHLKQLQAFNAE